MANNTIKKKGKATSLNAASSGNNDITEDKEKSIKT